MLDQDHAAPGRYFKNKIKIIFLLSVKTAKKKKKFKVWENYSNFLFLN